MQPEAATMRLPAAYGEPGRRLDWAVVEERLAAAMHYWLATTRPDGRPHVVPVDGLWSDGACYFGGHPATVHQRNLRADPRVVLHLDDGDAATIAEGVAEWHLPSAADEAAALAAAAKAKYGFGRSPEDYLTGTWRLRPATVLAWTVLHQDATRFTFA
jgi:hypothetical protein